MKKLSLQVLVTFFIVVCFFVILSRLPELSDIPAFQKASPQLQKLAQKTAEERQLLERETLTLQRVELRKREAELRAERAYIPTRQRNKELRAFMLTGAMAAGLFVAPLVLIVLIWQKSQEVSAIVMAWRQNTDLAATQDLIKLTIAQIGYNKELLKVTKQLPPELQEAITVKALSQQSKPIPNALQCLEQGIISGDTPSFFLGTTETGNHQNEDLHQEGGRSKHVGLIGEAGFGKSIFLVNVGTQGMLKGKLILAIDLHYPNKESFTEKFAPLSELPNFKGFHSLDHAIEAVYFLNDFLEKRLSGEIAKSPGVIVICDELKALMWKIKQKDKTEKLFEYVARLFERLVEEGGKCDISFVVASHTYKAEDLGTTAWKDGLHFKVGFHCSPRQAQTFGFDKEHKGELRKLVIGEMLYENDMGYYHKCKVPMWTPKAIEKAANMITPITWPDIAEPTQEDLDAYQNDIIKLSDYRQDLREEAKTLKYGEHAKFAKEHGVTPQTVARWKKNL